MVSVIDIESKYSKITLPLPVKYIYVCMMYIYVCECMYEYRCVNLNMFD
jgi:hypothetical protein